MNTILDFSGPLIASFFLGGCITGGAAFLMARRQALHTTQSWLKRYRQFRRRDRLRNSRLALLVEQSADIIFQADMNGQIESINRAVRTLLRYEPDELVGRNVLDLVFKSDDSSRFYNRHVFIDHLMELLDSKKSRRFQTELVSSTGDPLPMSVRLDYVEAHGRAMVLGRIFRPAEDALTGYCRRERQEYEFGNNFMLSELVSDRITERVAMRLEDAQASGVRLGVRELVVNAIEHGNLGITFDEKEKAKQRGEFMGLIKERQGQDPYRNRTVRVAYRLDDEKVEYTVVDQGQGFDHQQMLNRDISTEQELRRSSGRGIVLASALFDEVEYNAKGNEVRMVKYFSEKPAG